MLMCLPYNKKKKDKKLFIIIAGKEYVDSLLDESRLFFA